MTINNEHKKLNVPNLRFPEFQGEWAKCTLNEVCKFHNGRAYKQTELLAAGKYRVLRVGNFFTNDSWYYSNLELEDNKYAQNGDLLYAWSASFGPRFWREEKVIFHYHIWKIDSFKNVDKNFLYHFLDLDSAKIKNEVQGGTMVHITKGDMEKRTISYPSVLEQRNIARFLFLLDERIATQNKIIDKLQSLIKGLEDNLLDNPLWKKTYLRSFMQFFSTNSLSWEQLSYEEGEIRNLHYGLIHGFLTRGINSASLPMIKNEAIPKQYTLCQVGDVAFADASEDTGEIAKSVEFVDTIEGDTICGLHTIHGRDIKNRTVVGFKGFVFNSRYFHNQIKRLAQGTKVFSITANNLSSCYVYLPDLETQKAIVNLLKTYEAKLLVSKRLLEHYEKQKQYLGLLEDAVLPIICYLLQTTIEHIGVVLYMMGKIPWLCHNP